MTAYSECAALSFWERLYSLPLSWYVDIVVCFGGFTVDSQKAVIPRWLGTGATSLLLIYPALELLQFLLLFALTPPANLHHF